MGARRGGGGPQLLIGMPLYDGVDLVGETLKAIRAQTFKDYRLLISVDGSDERSYDACLSYAGDPRVELVLQPERLGWAGNVTWLARQLREGEDYFVYWQHDDLAEPTYLEELVTHARRHPEAAAVYCQMAMFGLRTRIGSIESFTGFALERVLRMIRDNTPTPIRCLNRADAITAALPITQVGPWAVTLARCGELHELPRPLYHRRVRADSLSIQMRSGGEAQLRASTLEWGVEVFRAALPAVSRPEQERLVLFVADQLVNHRPCRNFHFDVRGAGADGAVAFMREFLDGVRAATGVRPFAKLLDLPDARQRLARRVAAYEEPAAEILVIQALMAELDEAGG